MLAVFAVAAGLAGVPVYVYPQIDPLRKADAVYVLGGYSNWNGREIFGAKLYHEGWAPNLVISIPPANGSSAAYWWHEWCKYPNFGTAGVLGQPVEKKICPIADPGTTQGEARALRDLVREHGWHTVIVVTHRPHISRARLILQRCFSGDLIMVESPEEISFYRWFYEYLYQTAGFIKAAFSRGC